MLNSITSVRYKLGHPSAIKRSHTDPCPATSRNGIAMTSNMRYLVAGLLTVIILIVVFTPPLGVVEGRTSEPPWPTYHHDAQRTGRTTALGPTTAALRWQFDTGSLISSSPAIGADGAVYFGAWDGKLYALNADGTLRWTYQTESYISSSPALGPDGAVYFGSWDGYVYALNPDGTLRWRYQTGDIVTSSPVPTLTCEHIGTVCLP